MPQTRAELQARVNQIALVFNPHLTFLAYPLLTVDEQTQLSTAINKAYGQALAFEAEHAGLLSALAKGRPTITQTHGDVTSGAYNSKVAKTIEVKSNTGQTTSGVNQQIVSALKQLRGTTGHHPRKGDARVVDLTISEESNRWPLGGGTYGIPRPPATLDNIKDEAKRLVRQAAHDAGWGNVITRMKYTGHGLNLVRLRQWVDPTGATPHPNSSRLFYTNNAGDHRKVNALTIKIRWRSAYPLAGAPVGFQYFLQEMTLQIFRKPTNNYFSVKVAKTEVRHLHTATGAVTVHTTW